MTNDRAEIAHLISIYNNCCDRGVFSELTNVFAPGARIEVEEDTFEGVESFLEFLSAVKANTAGKLNLAGSRHHLTTSRVEFSSETEAQGWTYFFVMRRGEVLQEGLYVDHFTKRAEGWRISGRRVKMIWSL